MAAPAESAQESVQRAPAPPKHAPGARGGVADPEVERALSGARGSGSPVPAGVRHRMERVSGADFSGVRVHANAEADRLNDALGARAFTVGADVFVQRSEYAPGSARGDALLSHELAHTIQQGGARAYLQIFHNRQRRHSSLSMLAPIEYERLHTTLSVA